MGKLLAQQTMCLLQKYVSIFLSGIRIMAYFCSKVNPSEHYFLPASEGITVGTVKEV